MAQIEKVARETPHVADERLHALRSVYPEVFSEDRVDWKKFRSLLGDLSEERQEKYSFSWNGKRGAIQALQTPSRATLIPVKEESIHFDSTQNLFIEGDNLEVLKLLYKPYFGSVKLIYIDPPYNTGKEFIYPDNYAEGLETYLKFTGQKDWQGNLLTSNPETSGRYHSKWLSMMYPRLWLARQLLKDDGAIFISIDDHEVHNLRMLMNEIFGEENFIATIIWQKVYAPKNTARHFSEDHDYIVVYAKNSDLWLPTLLPRTEEANARYANPDNDSRGPWKPSDLSARNYYSEGQYEVTSPTGRKFKPPTGAYWRVSKEKFREMERDNRIWWGSDGNSVPAQKRFLSEVKQGIVPQTLWFYKDVGHTQDAKKELLEYVKFEHTDNVIDSVKPTSLIQRILQIATTPNGYDIVLDFFAGTASTAHAVLKQNSEDGGNRRFISVQLPEPLPLKESAMETIADVGKTRLGAAISELSRASRGKLATQGATAPDLGFRVFKLASSHYRPWESVTDGKTETLVKQLEFHADPLLPGWKPENVLYEISVKEGLSLSARVERVVEVKINTVFRVTDLDKRQSAFVCLDGSLKSETLKQLNLKKDTLFICRDVAVNDTMAANMALQCHLKTI